MAKTDFCYAQWEKNREGGLKFWVLYAGAKAHGELWILWFFLCKRKSKVMEIAAGTSQATTKNCKPTSCYLVIQQFKGSCKCMFERVLCYRQKASTLQRIQGDLVCLSPAVVGMGPDCYITEAVPDLQCNNHWDIWLSATNTALLLNVASSSWCMVQSMNFALQCNLLICTIHFD